MRSRDAGWWAFSVLAFVAAANGVAWLFYASLSDGPSSKEAGDFGKIAAVVPDVVGQDYESAKRELELAGFVVSPPTDPKTGWVKEQVPGGKTRRPVGETVQLKFGKEVVPGKTFPVPDVLSLSYDEASNRLRAAGLQVVAENRPADGRVARQAPPPGTPVSVGAVVTLHLRAPPPARLSGDVLVLLLETDALKNDQTSSALSSQLALVEEKLGERLIGGQVYRVKDSRGAAFPSDMIQETFAAGSRKVDEIAAKMPLGSKFLTVFVWLTTTDRSDIRDEDAPPKLKERHIGIVYWHSAGTEFETLPNFFYRTWRVESVRQLAGAMEREFFNRGQKIP
jgi:hypothetical protein